MDLATTPSAGLIDSANSDYLNLTKIAKNGIVERFYQKIP